MLWNELVKIALLGTENSKFSESTMLGLESLGIPKSHEPSVLLAEAAAVLAQLRKAGFLLGVFNGELPEKPKQVNEKAVSQKAVKHLQAILSGGQLPVLSEFLHLLQKSGKKLPASELPSLLHLPDFQTYWPRIEPLLGEDGRWLLRHHPHWRSYLQDPQQFNWQTGNKEERMAQIRFWRQQSPKFALELLTKTWDSESPADKANFLPLLAINISSEDEAFLEKCLDDRRKEVRSCAPPLLAKINSSQYSKRMKERVSSCFNLQGNSLKINMMESPDLATLRDGILQIHSGWAGGAKAGWLGQMMSFVDPVHWEVFFGKTPIEIMALFVKSDWAETLVRGIIEATVFHGNSKWAKALIEFWQKNETMHLWELPVCNQLPRLLSAADLNHLALKFLGQTNMLPTEYSPVFRLLKYSKANWSHELSLLILNRFRMDIVRDYRQIWQLQHLKEYLEMLALRSDPNLFEQFQTGWSNDSVQWRIWEKQVENLLTRVLFRREMRAELIIN